MNSLIRDPGLAPEGLLKIDWVKQHMPIMHEIRSEFERTQPFQGMRLAVSVHLEAKTAYLALVLRAAGAEVAVTGSNPLSTQDDVAAALVSEGIPVYAWHGATEQEYMAHLAATLEFRPHLYIDDGGDLTAMIHSDLRHVLEHVEGGCEETTTGLVRIRAMHGAGALGYPMIAVNDALCKHLFDNRYGTGQSVWDGIMRTTNLVVSGKTVVIAGFGWCGKGVALRAKGLGARVVITEVDPIKAMEAAMEGYQVMTMADAARIGDIFITVTGCRDVIRDEHIEVMADRAVLCNAGHFDVEVSKPDLEKLAVKRRKVRKNIEEFLLPDGRRIYLLAEGRLVNLAAADGHPAEIMDMSFGIQALALEWLTRKGKGLAPGVYPVPDAVDQKVARLKLSAWGYRIDELTETQRQYLSNWNIG